MLTGAFAFGAIQSALIKRFRTGRGDYIDATLIESAMALVTGDLQMPQIETDTRIQTFKAVRANDGFVMPVILTEKAFETLCSIIDPNLLAIRASTTACRARNTRPSCATQSKRGRRSAPPANARKR